MIFCTKCGTELNENDTVCPSCGEKVKSSSEPDFASKISKLNDTADATDTMDPSDIESNKIMAVLAYLSWLVLIPLLAAPKSKFARFHVNQGLVLAIIEIIWGVVAGIITSVITAIVPLLGAVCSGILQIVNVVFLILSIIGIINAATGKAKDLPIIGKFRIIK